MALTNPRAKQSTENQTLNDKKLTGVLEIRDRWGGTSSTFVFLGTAKEQVEELMKEYGQMDDDINVQINSHEDMYSHYVVAVIVDSEKTSVDCKNFIGDSAPVILWEDFQTWCRLQRQLWYL